MIGAISELLGTKPWRRPRAEAKGEEWAKLFAEIIQSVIQDLEAGKTNALSEFMYNETRRVLGEVPVLVVPGSS